MTHNRESVEATRKAYERTPGKFFLEAARGTRVNLWGPCSKCSQCIRPLWYYALSSRGPVYLCIRCKEVSLQARANRQGVLRKKDVLDMPRRLVAGSAFESNRRRH